MIFKAQVNCEMIVGCSWPLALLLGSLAKSVGYMGLVSGLTSVANTQGSKVKEEPQEPSLVPEEGCDSRKSTVTREKREKKGSSAQADPRLLSGPWSPRIR